MGRKPPLPLPCQNCWSPLSQSQSPHFSNKKQDVPSLLQYPQRPSPRTDPPHHLSTYRLATLLTLPLALSLLLFWVLSHRNPTLVIYYDFLPIAYLVLLLCLFFLPLRRFSSSGRTRFLTTLRRISIGGLAQANAGKFGDIILADVLTSYAKIIADLFVSLCMFFSGPNGSATARPDRGCGGQYLVPIIIAIPSLIRLRQCLIEYVRVRNNNLKNGGMNSQNGWGGQHLANALKYFSAFPVIILSALQRNLSLDHEDIGVTATTLYRLWLLAVFINSLYSFYWDVAKDWDLHFFDSIHQKLNQAAQGPAPSQLQHRTTAANLDTPFGLRHTLFFPNPKIYYYAIALDLLLRFTWSLKLSPHLDHFADFESGIFVMETLEVGRRWMWIFFRVETEWVRSLGGGKGDGLLGQEEEGMLLGDFSGGNSEED
jgi:EXS family